MLTANVSAYVKYVNTFVCHEYLHKIVVLCISVLRLNTTLSHSWVSMSLLMGILTNIILMSLKYPCLWVFKDPSIDFDICHGYLCKYLWQVYGLESSVMCQELKTTLMTSATSRYSWIILLIDNCMISVSSLLNTWEYSQVSLHLWVLIK